VGRYRYIVILGGEANRSVPPFCLSSLTWLPSTPKWTLPIDITNTFATHYIDRYGIYLINQYSLPGSSCWRLDIDNNGDDAEWKLVSPLPSPLYLPISTVL
jgi:hypothetical protein